MCLFKTLPAKLQLSTHGNKVIDQEAKIEQVLGLEIVVVDILDCHSTSNDV